MAGILDRIQDLFDRDDSRRITSPMAGRSRTVTPQNNFWTTGAGSKLADFQRGLQSGNLFSNYKLPNQEAAKTWGGTVRNVGIDVLGQMASAPTSLGEIIGRRSIRNPYNKFVSGEGDRFGEATGRTSLKDAQDAATRALTIRGIFNPASVAGYGLLMPTVSAGLGELGEATGFSQPKTFEQRWREALVDEAPGLAAKGGLYSYTNPLTSRIMGPTAPFLKRALTGGTMNVAEDVITSKGLGIDPNMTAGQVGASFLLPGVMDAGGKAVSGSLNLGRSGFNKFDNAAWNPWNWRARNVLENNKWIHEDEFSRGRFKATADAPQELIDIIGGRFNSRKQIRQAFNKFQKLYGDDPNFMGVALGIEPYQDEEGNWSVRYNPQKGLAGLAIGMGMSKVGGDYLYHVTPTKYIDSIKKEGLVPMKSSSNWEVSGTKKRYGDGEIYTFTDLQDAIKWAAKMDWEFNKDFGSGNISLVRLKNTGEWAIDTNDPMSQMGNAGKWLKRPGAVSPNDIDKSIPLTSDVIRDANFGKDLSSLFKNSEEVAAGAVLGVEPYQDENGDWRIRFNKQRALAGMAIGLGLKKVGGDDFNKLLGDQKIPDDIAKNIEPETTGIKYNPDGTVSKTAENFEAKRMKLAEEISRIAKTFAKESGLAEKPNDYFYNTRQALNNKIMAYNLNADKLGIPRMKEIRVSDQINDIAKQNYPNQSKPVAQQMQQPNEIKKDIAKFTDQFKGKPVSLDRAIGLLETSNQTAKDFFDFIQEARRGTINVVGGTAEQKGVAMKRLYNVFQRSTIPLRTDIDRVLRLGMDRDEIVRAIENNDTSNPLLEGIVKNSRALLDSFTSAQDIGIFREGYFPRVSEEVASTTFMDLQYNKSLLGNLMYDPTMARTGKDWLGTAGIKESLDVRALAEIDMALQKLGGINIESKVNMVDQLQDQLKKSPDFVPDNLTKFDGQIGAFKQLSNRIRGLDTLFETIAYFGEGANSGWQDMGMWNVVRDMYLSKYKKPFFDADMQKSIESAQNQQDIVGIVNRLADVSGLEGTARNNFIGNAMTNLNRAGNMTRRRNILKAMSRKTSRFAFIDEPLKPLEKFLSTHEITNQTTKNFIDGEIRELATYHKDLNNFDNALQKSRRLMQLGVIGANVSTALKQPFEIFRALGEYKSKNFAQSMLDFARGERSQFDWMINQDKQYAYLVGDKKVDPSVPMRVFELMEKAGFYGMRAAENAKNRIFIRGAELDGIEKGLSGKQLENYVFDNYIKSAHTYETSNVPRMMRSEKMKWLMMFQTYGMKQTSYMMRTLDNLLLNASNGDKEVYKQLKAFAAVGLGAYAQMFVFDRLFGEKQNKKFAIQTATGGMPGVYNPLLSAGKAQYQAFVADDEDAKDRALAERDRQLKNIIPFNNQLVNKTGAGFKYIQQGYVDSKSGKSVNYVGPESKLDKIRVLVFGPKASAEARAFFEGGSRSYGSIDTERIRQASQARGAGGTLAVAQKIAKTKDLEEANKKAKAYVLNNQGTMETEDKIWYYEDGDAHSINKVFEIDKPDLTGVKEIDDKITKDYNTRLGKIQSNIAKLVEIGKMSTDEARERIVEINKLQLLTKPVPKKPTLTGNQFIDTEILTDYNGELTTYLNDSMEMYEAGMLSQEQFATRIKGTQAMKDLISDLKKSFKGPSTKTSKRSTKLPKIPSSQRPPAMKQYSQSSVPVFTPPPLATKIDFSKYVKDVKQPQRTQFRKLQRI